MTTRRRMEFVNAAEGQSVGTTLPTLHLVDVVALGVDNCGVRADVTLVAKETSTGKVAIVRGVCAFGVAAGVLTKYGSFSATTVGDATLLTAGVGAMDVSSNKLLIQGFGVSGKTLTWTGWLDLYTGET